jgi:hypothetical protein
VSVDLGPLFALAEGLVRSAVDTAGTTVQIRIPSESSLTAAITPGSLDVITAAEETLEDETPAIVVPSSAGPTGFGLPSPADAAPGDYTIVMTVDVPTVELGCVIEVLDCLEAGLIGERFLVTRRLDSSAAAGRIVIARRVIAGVVS